MLRKRGSSRGVLALCAVMGVLFLAVTIEIKCAEQFGHRFKARLRIRQKRPYQAPRCTWRIRSAITSTTCKPTRTDIFRFRTFPLIPSISQ